MTQTMVGAKAKVTSSWMFTSMTLMGSRCVIVGIPIRQSRDRTLTNKSTSVPLGGQVSAHEVYVTAQEGLYRLETVITVAAEEKRHDKVVARAIGITSPCFEFAG